MSVAPEPGLNVIDCGVYIIRNTRCCGARRDVVVVPTLKKSDALGRVGTPRVDWAWSGRSGIWSAAV